MMKMKQQDTIEGKRKKAQKYLQRYFGREISEFADVPDQIVEQFDPKIVAGLMYVLDDINGSRFASYAAGSALAAYGHRATTEGTRNRFDQALDRLPSLNEIERKSIDSVVEGDPALGRVATPLLMYLATAPVRLGVLIHGDELFEELNMSKMDLAPFGMEAPFFGWFSRQGKYKSELAEALMAYKEVKISPQAATH